MAYGPADFAWSILGKLSPIGPINQQATTIGFKRLRGLPPFSGMWIGSWNHYSMTLDARLVSTKNQTGRVYFRIDGFADSPQVPRIQIERLSRENWSKSGSEAANAWIEADYHFYSTFQPQSLCLRISPRGFRWESIWSGPPSIRKLLTWITRLYATLAQNSLENLLFRRIIENTQEPHRSRMCRAYLVEFSPTKNASVIRQLCLKSPNPEAQLIAKTAGLHPSQAFKSASSFAMTSELELSVRAQAIKIIEDTSQRLTRSAHHQALSILGQLLNSEISELKRLSLAACEHLGQDAIPLIAEALEDPDIYESGILHLCNLCHKGAESVLIDILSVENGHLIIPTLTQEGSEACIPKLLDIVGSRPSSRLKKLALEAIREIRARHAKQPPEQLAAVAYPSGPLTKR